MCLTGEKDCIYISQSLDDFNVVFVFLDFLSESDGLLHLCWVDVLWPASLSVVHASIFTLIPLRVGLRTANH